MITTFSSSLFTEAVAAAVKAPAISDSQPWSFRRNGENIEIHADPVLALAATDPTGWGTRVSIGAAICNLTLTLAWQQQPATVALLPDPTNMNLIARICPGEPRPATPAEQALHAAIDTQHSARRVFGATPTPTDIRTRLRQAVHDGGCWMDLLISQAAVDLVGQLTQEAHRILTADPAYCAERPTWAEPEPLLGILGGYGDDAVAELTCGQAMQRTLLTAATHGLSAALFPQTIQVPAIREQLRLGLARPHLPQMVIRFDHIEPALLGPRCELTEVIMDI